MIFSSEQPQTGMNEGTWFTQGMCIKNEGIICREEEEEDEEGGGRVLVKKKSLLEYTCRDLLWL